MSQIPRSATIVAAAGSVFRRHGYRKTSMQDLAEAAGVSRPTLYAAFPDKRAVFSALVVEATRENSLQSRERLAKTRGLARRVHAVLDIWIVAPYVEYWAREGPEDIVTVAADVAPEAMQNFWSACEASLKEALSGSTRWNDAFIHEVVFVMLSAIRDAKKQATSAKELQRSVDVLVHVIEELARVTERTRTST